MLAGLNIGVMEVLGILRPFLFNIALVCLPSHPLLSLDLTTASDIVGAKGWQSHSLYCYTTLFLISGEQEISIIMKILHITRQMEH